MTTSSAISSERLADHFVAYLFDQYRGVRHVRRVATWIGFLLRAIENLAGSSLKINRKRQITFKYRGHRFKARYNHKVGRRGGLEVLEFFAAPGSPEGKVALQVTSLAEAEKAYLSLRQKLDLVVDA